MKDKAITLYVSSNNSLEKQILLKFIINSNACILILSEFLLLGRGNQSR